jgi:hypothetical protein
MAFTIARDSDASNETRLSLVYEFASTKPGDDRRVLIVSLREGFMPSPPDGWERLPSENSNTWVKRALDGRKFSCPDDGQS